MSEFTYFLNIWNWCDFHFAIISPTTVLGFLGLRQILFGFCGAALECNFNQFLQFYQNFCCMRQQLQTQTYQLSSEFNMDFQRKLGETSFLEHKSNQTMMSFYPHTTSHFFPSEEDHFWWEISIMLLLRETETKSWSCYELIQIWSYTCSSSAVNSAGMYVVEMIYYRNIQSVSKGAKGEHSTRCFEAMICFWWTPLVGRDDFEKFCIFISARPYSSVCYRN